MNAPTPEQIETLLSTSDLLNNSGTTLVTTLVIALVLGSIAVGLLFRDWSQNRRRNWPAFGAIALGIVLMIAGNVLYGAAGRIIAIEINTPRVWVGTEYEALSNQVKMMAGSSGGWGVIGLTAGMLFILLGVIGIVRNFLLRHRSASPEASATMPLRDRFE